MCVVCGCLELRHPLFARPLHEMAFQEVKDRISLVARLLTSLQGRNAAYSRASDEQSIVLAQKLASAKLSLEEVTEAAEAVKGVSWQDASHLERVQASLVSGGGGGGGGGGGANGVVGCRNTRRPLQNFEAIPDYYTDQQWRLFSSDAMPAQKLRVLLEQPHRLGLRCASEPTARKITVLYMCITNAPLEAKAMPVSQKLSLLRFVKAELKSLGDQPVAEWLKKLPDVPEKLRCQSPGLYTAVFSEPPVPMKIDMQLFAELVSSVRCRGQRSAESLEGTNFSQVASQFMSQMQQMQQMQIATMQALTGRSSTSRLPAVMLSSDVSNLQGGLSRPSQLSLPAPPTTSALVLSRAAEATSNAGAPSDPGVSAVERAAEATSNAGAPSDPLVLSRAAVERAAEATSNARLQPSAAEVLALQPSAAEVPAKRPGKQPRLSVAESMALISKKLDERQKDKENNKDKGKGKDKGQTSAKGKAKAKAKAKSIGKTTTSGEHHQ